jgi:hypothetical protein
VNEFTAKSRDLRRSLTRMGIALAARLGGDGGHPAPQD